MPSSLHIMFTFNNLLNKPRSGYTHTHIVSRERTRTMPASPPSYENVEKNRTPRTVIKRDFERACVNQLYTD